MTTGESERMEWSYVATLWRYKWMIVAICAATVGVTLVVTVASPKTYQSEAALLVPREGGVVGGLSALPVSGLLQQIPGLSLPSLTPNRDMLVSILRSQRVAKAVVERFRLQERYRGPSTGHQHHDLS